jgi:hypothetical protein
METARIQWSANGDIIREEHEPVGPGLQEYFPAKWHSLCHQDRERHGASRRFLLIEEPVASAIPLKVSTIYLPALAAQSHNKEWHADDADLAD